MIFKSQKSILPIPLNLHYLFSLISQKTFFFLITILILRKIIFNNLSYQITFVPFL